MNFNANITLVKFTKSLKVNTQKSGGEEGGYLNVEGGGRKTIFAICGCCNNLWIFLLFSNEFYMKDI